MTEEADLEAKILELTGELVRLRESKKRPFVAGESKIPYAGRVFDEREVQAAVKASLDAWITLGPEGEAFEKRLAEILGVKFALLANSGSSANLLAFAALTSPTVRRRVEPGWMRVEVHLVGV